MNNYSYISNIKCAECMQIINNNVVVESKYKIFCKTCGNGTNLLNMRTKLYFSKKTSEIIRVFEGEFRYGKNAIKTKNMLWFDDFIGTEKYVEVLSDPNEFCDFSFESTIPLHRFLVTYKNSIISSANFQGYYRYRPRWSSYEFPCKKIVTFLICVRRIMGGRIPKLLIFTIVAKYLRVNPIRLCKFLSRQEKHKFA